MSSIASQRETFNQEPMLGVDAPIGFPQTGLWPATAGVVTKKVTANTAQTFTLPDPCGTEQVFIRLDIAGLGSETVALTVVYGDGTTTETCNPFLLSTGALQDGTALGNGSYALPKNLGIKKVITTKSAGSDVTAQAVAWVTVPRK